MLITIIIFVAILSLLVFVHELGHFWTARRFGVKVDEFGFGLPPRIFGIAFRSTLYSLNWIPVGGFVKIKGENGEAAESEDSFAHKKIWQRAIIIASGVIMNLMLCMILLAIGFGIGLPTLIGGESKGAVISEKQIQVIEVVKGTPAQAAGLKAGDVFFNVDNNVFENVGDLHNYLQKQEGKTVQIKIKRGREEITKNIAVLKYQDNIGIGVALVETGLVRYPWHLAIFEGIKTTFIWLWLMVAAFALLIKNLIIGAPVGVEVAGPVGIAVLTSQATKMGLIYVWQFTAFLSLNLAIINFLPFPALDGGRALFLVIEKARGRAIKQQWENLAHNIGFILLMVLVVFLTYRDLLRYGGRILGAVKGVVGL